MKPSNDIAAKMYLPTVDSLYTNRTILKRAQLIAQFQTKHDAQ